MHASYHGDSYEVGFEPADARLFAISTDAEPGVVQGRGSFVFDAATGDLLDARGSAQGRSEIEWLAFSQDAQDFGREQLGRLGVEVNPFDFRAHMPEIARNPTRISRTRGVKTMKGPYSRARGYGPWIRERGSLGKGFLTSMTSEQRKKALDRCVRKHGYRSCLGKIMALERARTGAHGKGPGVGVKYASKLAAAREYLREAYGGPGSFGPRHAQLAHAAEHGPGYALANPPAGLDTGSSPKAWAATGAFVGALAGGLPGAAVGSSALTLLGWMLGGYGGARYMAPVDRSSGAGLGGAVGGFFTPIGAAIGGAIGAASPDR